MCMVIVTGTEFLALLKQHSMVKYLTMLLQIFGGKY